MNIILLRQAEKTVLASLEYAKMLKKKQREALLADRICEKNALGSRQNLWTRCFFLQHNTGFLIYVFYCS